MTDIEFHTLGFDRDEGNREHCRKHGIDLDEIEALFGTDFLLLKDQKHSENENRMLALGFPPATKKPFFVAFTFRDKNNKRLIRPISARYMHDKEARRYEQKTAKI